LGTATKLILDTDIGTDVDDAWALALCLASPDIDLVGVTLVHADLDTRARIALKMLRLAGRDDIPVYKGLSETLTDGGRLYWAGHEGTDTDFSDIVGLEAREGGVDFILESIERYPGEIVVAPVGPLTNIAAAISRAPETMRKVKKLAVMGTTYCGEGPGCSEREHNGCVDPEATKVFFDSGIPATVVGMNVSMQVRVRSDDLPPLERSALGKYLVAMTRQYYRVCGRDFTYMHDPLAIAAVIDPSVVTTRRMSGRALEDGRAVYTHDDTGVLDVCTNVDVERFETMLLSRIGLLADQGE